MKKRSPVAVLILPLVTFGIYSIVWHAKTAGEFKSRGADVPHWILLFIPLVNLWWLWKWSGGVEKATNGGMGAAISFILILFLGPIGMCIIQSSLNKVA